MTGQLPAGMSVSLSSLTKKIITVAIWKKRNPQNDRLYAPASSKNKNVTTPASDFRQLGLSDVDVLPGTVATRLRWGESRNGRYVWVSSRKSTQLRTLSL